VVTGTPEQVMRSRKSFTAEALRKMLAPERAA
jgi:excinuclease UvrABC ATPase subunit